MSTWEQRADEARLLALAPVSTERDRRLVDLLLDDEDTAVSQAAADALLEHDGMEGLRLYVLAFGRAEETTRNELGDCLYDESGTRWQLVEARVPALQQDTDPDVRAGAERLSEHLREQARRDRS